MKSPEEQLVDLLDELIRFADALFLARSKLRLISEYGLEGDSAELNYACMKGIARQAVEQIDKTIR